MGGKTALTLSIVTLLVTMSAHAQEEAAEAEAGEAEATAEATDASAAPQAPEASAPAADGGRFRWGINGAAGLESVSEVDASGAMFGFDLRLGWQVNNLLAIYAQPHLSFGSLSMSGAGVELSGFTATFIGTVMGELTFLDRFFAGAGFGYGVFNNPSGLALDFRAGGYPLMGRGPDGIRRDGLMVGVDFRTVFLDGATGILFMGCVGYEAF